MNPDNKMFHQPFHEWLELVLRSDDYIKLSSYSLALLVKEHDKDENLCHVEIGKDGYFLWNIKAWKSSNERYILFKKKNEQDTLEWSNLKDNLTYIAKWYQKITNQPYEVCWQLALDMFSNCQIEQIETVIGSKLKQPYYKGKYVFL